MAESMIAWLQTWLPFLIALMPSVITGLSTIPRAQGWIPTVLKVMRILSIVTHRDEEGTFRAPGPKAPVPAELPSVPRERKATLPGPVSPPPIPKGMILLLALLPLVASCTPAQKQIAKEKAIRGVVDLAACATEEVSRPLTNGLANVLTNNPSWRADLIGAGSTAVKCALLALVQQLRADVVPSGEEGVAARGSALSADPQDQVEKLAKRCEEGPCERVEERAAWILAQGRGR